MTGTRALRIDDADALYALRQANAAFLAPWEPLAPPGGSTREGQRETLARLIDQHDAGRTVAHVILDGEEIIGRITLSNLVRGAFQSCHLGYWVAEAHNGRGHATAAVAGMCELAFDALNLHRIEAGTLVHNDASQRVLAHNGFVRFGLAPAYLRIAGRWQDHVLFQRLSPRAD